MVAPVFPPVDLASTLAPWDSNPRPLIDTGAAGGMHRPSRVPGIATVRESARAAESAQSVFEAHRYARIVEFVSPVAVAGSALLQSPIIGQSDALRNMLMLRNSSATANIYVSFGVPASLNSLIRLTPNTILLMDTVVPQDDIYAFADAASGFVVIGFSTIVRP